MASRHSNSKLLFGWHTVKHAGSTLAIFDWLDFEWIGIDLIGEPIRCISRWHFSLSHVIHFDLGLSEEKICIENWDYWENLRNLCYFVLTVFNWCSVRHLVKMNERRYSDIVFGSGKFIFAVSTGYLFGCCCNLCASVFTWPRAIACLSGSSDSESELLCR